MSPAAPARQDEEEGDAASPVSPDNVLATFGSIRAMLPVVGGKLPRSHSSMSVMSVASTFTRTTQFAVTVLPRIAPICSLVKFRPGPPGLALTRTCTHPVQVQAPEGILVAPIFFQVTVSNCHRGTTWMLSRRYQAFDSVQAHLRFWGLASADLELPPKHPKPGLDPGLLAERAAGLQAWAAEVLSTDCALNEARVIAFFKLPRICNEAELIEAEAALQRIQAAVLTAPFIQSGLRGDRHLHRAQPARTPTVAAGG